LHEVAMPYDEWKANDTTDYGDEEPEPDGLPCEACKEPFVGDGLTCSADCARRLNARLARSAALEHDIDVALEEAS
jgi:hypothetical protein